MKKAFLTVLVGITTVASATFAQSDDQSGDKANVALTQVAKEHLLLDLNADHDVVTEDGAFVRSWTNQVADSKVGAFVKQDEGRKVPGSGRPTLRKSVDAIGGHATIVFKRQELVNDQDDVFDHLITGSGHTWFSVIAVDDQVGTLKNVNSFFGNLRNGDNYEGFWGGFTDDNRFWIGVRNGLARSRWTKHNPLILAEKPLLKQDRFYVLAGRMSAGQGVATIDAFINDSQVKATGVCEVNPDADSQRMVVGQERDAIEHPGHECFDGEIARLLIYDRPFNEHEVGQMMNYLKREYQIGKTSRTTSIK